MELFWQLSGPESQVVREWKGENLGNAAIARQVYKHLAFKRENGTFGLNLILGIESSGASHILIPYTSRGSGLGLNWRNNAQPYRGSKYASLSPICVDTDLKLKLLLEDRQKLSKPTGASKNKEDNSKANGRYWNTTDATPNMVRAAFEHGRCLWRVLQDELRPQVYGLPDAPWRASLQIFSLALNFWVPDGVKPTDKLLDASLTNISPESVRKDGSMVYMTWFFIAKENQSLQNSSLAEGRIISETWDSASLSEVDIGPKIQDILASHSHPRDTPPAPLILLVHDYHTVKAGLESLGLRTSEWKYGAKELLGFNTFDYDRGHERRRRRFTITQETNDPGHASSSRVRSCSPRTRTPTGLLIRGTRSPSPTRTYAPVYVVDVLEMFQAVTGHSRNARRVRPIMVYNTLSGRHETNDWCAGSDATYIAESWKIMVQGPSIDEQTAIYERAPSGASWPGQHDDSGSPHADSEAPEDEGLFHQQQDGPTDLFHDGPNSDDEYL